MDPKEKVATILARNEGKNFVQRIVNKDAYPVLNNPDGSYSTHSMAWGEAGGKYYVYPTVIQKDKTSLERLPGRQAWRHAMQSGEYIQFSTPQEADWFSKNYKAVWDK